MSTTEEHERQYYYISEHIYALKAIADIHVASRECGFEETGLLRVFSISLEAIIGALDNLMEALDKEAA